jgi:lipopolysaccharide/colanic/teichoic acid biosynthesis glycosyltransferase
MPLARRRYLHRKYKIERAIGFGLLVPAAPVILGICLIVKLTSRGPGLYRQVRVGHNGQEYEILKIRTMRTDAESDGVARWCVKNDPRITRLGSFLRKVHLDELPQLINVAKGEMVLVGPRPERPSICEKLAKDIERYYDRVQVKPGITGLSQINLPPDETLDDARRKQILDLQYIAEANAWLDLRMIAATALRMCGVRGDRVTKMMRLCRKTLLTDNAIADTSPLRRQADLENDADCVIVDDGGQSVPRRPNLPRRPR